MSDLDLDWLKDWYDATMATISTMFEFKTRYKHMFYTVQDRIIKLGEILKNKIEEEK